ncbi:hypothetical protein, partial [Bacillus amyloliquefaciens]|uniref:hypothetical protein n=1 Tax=Bacillus amyloliquefaciens TaxID=1390 RepID=UPI000A7B286E
MAWIAGKGRNYTVVHRLEELNDVETPKIIYCPVAEELEPEYCNALMSWVYKRENTILWIDELMEVAPIAHNDPKELKALYTRGRSIEAVVWACTQRATDIPVIAMANSSHYFIFTMQNPDDRKKIVKATGMPQFEEQPGGHNFWYWKVGMQNPVLAKPEALKGVMDWRHENSQVSGLKNLIVISLFTMMVIVVTKGYC